MQEKESILKRLDENERYITSLQEKIKELINEKDALSGKVKSLEQEKELFKVNIIIIHLLGVSVVPTIVHTS